MNLADTRRANVRALVKANGGTTAVSKRLGYRNASFLSQQLGPKPTREVTEKTARALEEEFKLAPGSLDLAADAPPAVETSAGGAISTALVADVIRLVGTALEAEGVQAVGPAKFSELVALAFADTMDHQGQPREQHVRTLARLLK